MSPRKKRRLRVPLALVCVALVFGQLVRVEAVERIEVAVTGVSGDSIYLDQGRGAGVRVGDQVLLRDPKGGTITAIVRSVARGSARCLLSDRGLDAARVSGSRGQVLIRDAEARRESEAAATTRSAVWERSDGALFDAREGSAGVILERRVTPESFLDSFRVTLKREGRKLIGLARFRYRDDPKLFELRWELSETGPSTYRARCESYQDADRGPQRAFVEYDFMVRPRSSVGGSRGGVVSGGRRVPEHAPWAEPVDGWDSSMPLLAPARALRRDERDAELRGRAFAQYNHTMTRGAASNQYSLGRIGLSLSLDNPFGLGGSFNFDGDVSMRSAWLADGDDEQRFFGRIDRLSYAWGGTRDEPLRIELGRFLHSELPELGVIDGAEMVYRLASHSKVGVSGGFLPEFTAEMRTGDDLAAAIFYRFTAGDHQELSAAVAYQKSFHKGQADRDLLVANLDILPGEHFSFTGTALADIYGSGDRIKSGLELTQAIARATLQTDPGHGIGAQLTYYRIPELLRDDFEPSIQDLLLEGEVLRYGVFTWQTITDALRLDARLDRFRDQRQAGYAWEFGAALSDWPLRRLTLRGAVFGNEGEFTTARGLRLTASQAFERGSITFGYDLTRYAFEGQVASEGSVQHGVNLNLNYNFTSTLSGSMYADYRFGGAIDSMSVGLFIQKRF